MTVMGSKATLFKRKTSQFEEEEDPLSVLSRKFSPFRPPSHRAALASLCLGPLGSRQRRHSISPFGHLPLISFGVSRLSSVMCTEKEQRCGAWLQRRLRGHLAVTPGSTQVIYCDRH